MTFIRRVFSQCKIDVLDSSNFDTLKNYSVKMGILNQIPV